ncbi:dihydrofolate reductase [Cereibacter sphaeroides]|uniref:dihydrofolate reductase n=1 Tax=Cereibacter sphaeroides TaxID=1063 RepID=UPI000F5317C9|nr:dihydrofolate reductase [Cereibacter sphaeroides]AZB63247.1 dihydrofolate reductase [Cereibacter sphaeroides]AZB68835.1 dihydrofolate reductase [Cereibacter sphaeroides]
MLTLVVARARDGAIGRDGTIPWAAPEDLAFFQRETLGGAVIMGRRTWESLPKRPLPRRMNIVVTSRPMEGEALFTSFEAAIPAAEAAGHARIYSIGGARIFSEHLPLADRLLVTEVDLEVPDADTFFPAFDPKDWNLAARIALRSEAPACVLYEYLRRR